MKRFLLILMLALSGIHAGAQQKLSELDLSRATQTYGTLIAGRSVTGEAAVVAGEECVDPVGVYPDSHIRINLKGFAFILKGKIGVADSEIDYQGSGISSNPQPDGTRVFFHEIDGVRYFAGVEDPDRVDRQGSVTFRIFGDGKEIFSRKMSAGEKMIPLDVNLRGIKVLDLKVDDSGDGSWGDFAVWSDVSIDFDVHNGVSLSTDATSESEGVSEDDWKRMSGKLKALPVSGYPDMEVGGRDWLIEPGDFKAKVMAGKDGKSIVISNGLAARVFRITPNLATVDIVNQMLGENMLRAVSPEGEVTINGHRWFLGGLEGQQERGYLKTDWLDDMSVRNNSFIVEDFEVRDSVQTLEWARNRWALNKENPTGKCLVFTMKGSGDAAGIRARLYYDIYDHIPVIRKHMELVNNGNADICIDSFKLETLAFMEPESPVSGDPDRFILPNIHIESDYHTISGFDEKRSDSTEKWVPDKEYTSQRNYPLLTPCILEVAPPLGPSQLVKPGGTFRSFKVYEMPYDSDDRERKGLFNRRFQYTLNPWTTENPIFMHLTSTDEEVVHRAVDQCAECGYEMVILSFGSGLNAEDLSEQNIARFKAMVDYAASKGIELGCYSLLASRSINAEVDVVNSKTGKPGGACYGSAPCLCSDWGHEYIDKIRTFIEKTGMKCFEHDGSYAGDVCASVSHTYHKGLEDSQWNQFQRISGLYNWMCRTGVYINVPDYYFMNGSTKVAIGYREVNWSLPRDRQLIHTRQLNYDCTWERLPSSLWSFVPLVQYQGGGAAATLEPLSEHLYEYRTLMFQNYGAGVQACYRGPRLYDTEETKQTVIEVINWYRKYRDILNSDIIHLRRPDARNWDGIMHVNPKLEEKALAMFYNPTDEDMVRTITLPLYYTGLEKTASIREQEGKARTYRLDREYNVELKVSIPAGGYTWFVVE